MHELLIVVLTVLAVHRLTYLVVSDKITKWPRERVQDWFETRWWRRHGRPASKDRDEEWQSYPAYALSCPWCASVWVGAAVVAVVWGTIGLPVPILVWLAASSVTGAIESRR